MQTSQILRNEIVAPVERNSERGSFVNEIVSDAVAEQVIARRPRILERRAARWARRTGH
ncbi:MAG: hypothetical protein AAFV54_13300 [Pseudomonadota bacterium]